MTMGSFTFLEAKKIGVFGLSVTGMAAYAAICDIVSEILVWDDKAANREEFALKFGDSSLLAISNIRWQSLDQIILSPGIPLTHEIRKIANQHEIEITSDIDVLFRECNTAKFIGITGTNGKSTTTELIYHILKNSDYDFAIGGNIGIPALALPTDKKGYVLELSSFQLDLTKTFRASLAILLNITSDHLDRYKTIEQYSQAKEKILNLLSPDGFGIVGVDNHITEVIFKKFSENNPNIIPISSTQIVAKGVSVIGNKIHDNVYESVIFDLPENKSLQGDHNKENIAASIAVCRILGMQYQKILDSIKSFKGLPHRAEYIGNHRNVNFYNDSKATNAEAASKSISFLDNIYWLAGGIAKEGGIQDLSSLFNKIKKAYLFGQGKNQFAESLEGKVQFKLYDNLNDAFAEACLDALNNEATIKNVLLAPAAASTDQFKNFEHRGETFKQLYNDFKESDGQNSSKS